MKNLAGCALALAGCLLAGCSTAEDATVETEAVVTESGTASPVFDFQGDFKGPLGLQLWSVREQMQADVTGTLTWVRSQGFTEVELAGTYGLTPEAFRAELDAAGLTATAMHVSYEQMRDNLEAVLNEAGILGAARIGVAWIPHEGSYTPEAARATAADFNQWGQAVAARGYRFYYHTHGYEFEPAADGTVPFDVLVEATDPATVGFEMDVFWVTHPGVDPAALLRKYPDRWELMHIKDMTKGTPVGDYSGSASAEAEVAVGQGQIDYRAVLEAAAEVGVERYYLEDETANPMGNIPVSVDFLEGVTFGGGA